MVPPSAPSPKNTWSPVKMFTMMLSGETGYVAVDTCSGFNCGCAGIGPFYMLTMLQQYCSQRMYKFTGGLSAAFLKAYFDYYQRLPQDPDHPPPNKYFFPNFTAIIPWNMTEHKEKFKAMLKPMFCPPCPTSKVPEKANKTYVDGKKYLSFAKHMVGSFMQTVEKQNKGKQLSRTELGAVDICQGTAELLVPTLDMYTYGQLRLDYDLLCNCESSRQKAIEDPFTDYKAAMNPFPR